jgi:hypothetical protein
MDRSARVFQIFVDVKCVIVPNRRAGRRPFCGIALYLIARHVFQIIVDVKVKIPSRRARQHVWVFQIFVDFKVEVPGRRACRCL